MYTDADRVEVRSQLRSRWLVTTLPAGSLFAAAVAVFVACQVQRRDWGWMLACALTILSGFSLLFLYGVYLRPMRLYARHIDDMLEGRKRETTGYLTEIAETAVDRDGLDWYAITVNVGEKGDPEDDRLLYYDALKGKPAIPLGTRVVVASSDKVISEMHEG